MLNRYHPSPGRVVVQRDSVGKVSEGGIIIPDVAQEFGRTATVVAVGGVRTLDGRVVDTWIKRGDRVLTNKHAGLALENAGEDGEVAILKEDEIFCVVEEGK